ncbi:MAG: hypothetical protein NC115_01905 [Bacteroidales bacterium]|nr:hypothetical protein [Bacteroidales bacterium]
MNARLYDPLVGRFLSPDPYVQMPDFIQNFNRYSYALNNPLRYRDESGEVIIGTILTFICDFFVTLFDGGVNFDDNIRKNAWKRFDPSAPWSKTYKAFKIDMGTFQTDTHKNGWERAWNVFSRWTWESLQVGLGRTVAHFKNAILGKVDRVEYFCGATYVINEDADVTQGVTLGNFINIDDNEIITTDFKSHLLSKQIYMHEFGHYIDSRRWGLIYPLAIGLPSLFSASIDTQRNKYEHKYCYTEIRANKLASKYFNKHYNVTWDETKNPISKPKKQTSASTVPVSIGDDGMWLP